MAYTPIPTYYQLTTYINGPLGGFTEKYALKASASFTAAEAAAVALINARVELLASGFKVVRAVLSDAATKRDSMVVNGYNDSPVLLDAETDLLVDALDNSQEVGILVRFDSGDGQFSNRLIRGIRDSWVEDQAMTFTPSAAYPANGPYLTYATSPTLDTSADVVANFLSIVRDSTMLARPNADVTNPFKRAYYTEYQVSNVSKRDTGLRTGLARGRQAVMS